MRKPVKLRHAAVVAAILSLSAASCYVEALPPRGIPRFEFRSESLVGDELRVLLETATEYQPFASHSLKISSAKGWLITVDLSKKGPIGERARVIGPLWDVPGERSSLSFTAGANFTKKDVAAVRATPFIDFASDGTVVRIRADPKGGSGMIRERLIIDAKPFWKPDGLFLPLPRPGRPMNEETVETMSGRYRLQLADGKTTLHERLTGKRIPDPWLEAAFTACRSIKDFENVRTWLTDDLKYLVSSPKPIWMGVHASSRTFESGGKTYRRGQYGLAWQRPRPDPFVFKKPRNEDAASREHIAHALSLDGLLYFLYMHGTLAWIPAYRNEQPMATLIPFSGGPTYQVKPPGVRRAEWGITGPRPLQQLDKPTRIVFFRKNDYLSQDALDHVHDEAVVVFIWNLQNGTMSIYDAPTGQLFGRRGDEYVPKRSSPAE